MEKHFSIVKVDHRPHRVIAQENWGLSSQQMRGLHVHHRIPISEGGTNDPSNLYVCSPSFHRWVWHDGEEFIEWANLGGQLATIHSETHGTGFRSLSKEQRKEYGQLGGLSNRINSTGIFSRTSEEWSQQNRINGQKGGRHGGQSTFEKGVGLFAMGEDEKKIRNRKGSKICNSIFFMCLETGHICTAGGMGMFQKARGIDKSRRVRMSPEEMAFIHVWK